MSQILSTLNKSGRAIIVALVLGAGSVAALPMPAMAQSGPSFNFNLGGGTDSGPSFDRNRDGRHHDRDSQRQCLTDRDISRGLGRAGFRNVDITRELSRNRVELVAQYGRSWYKLRVDRCSGSAQVIERLRRGNSGFGLQFNFGN